jgi:DNA polymerase-3 subunit delta'
VPRQGETRPVHPDVVVLERGLYEPATIGRRSPESQDISIDQVRTLVLSRASFPPYEGRAKVFVVRRAEELSVAAANALLKTLEEPGARTCFILVCSAGDALLPTIRSRTQRVRFGVLPDDVVAELLQARGVERDRAVAIAPLAGGTMASALALADGEETARRDEFVARAIAGIDARDLGLSLEFAEEAKKSDKHALVGLLEALAFSFAAHARAAAAAGDGRAVRAAVRHELVVAAITQIEASAATQLAIEAMMIKNSSVVLPPGKTSYSRCPSETPTHARVRSLPAMTTIRSGPRPWYSATTARSPTIGAPLPARATPTGNRRTRSNRMP